jgi:hypothetical protein
MNSELISNVHVISPFAALRHDLGRKTEVEIVIGKLRASGAQRYSNKPTIISFTLLQCNTSTASSG